MPSSESKRGCARVVFSRATLAASARSSASAVTIAASSASIAAAAACIAPASSKLRLAPRLRFAQHENRRLGPPPLPSPRRRRSDARAAAEPLLRSSQRGDSGTHQIPAMRARGGISATLSEIRHPNVVVRRMRFATPAMRSPITTASCIMPESSPRWCSGAASAA